MERDFRLYRSLVIAMWFSCGTVAASADVIYTVTTTGTITGGISYGTFGASGTNLTGQSYTAIQIFDATLSSYGTNGSGTNYLNPATSSAFVTVNGYTYATGINSGNNEYYSVSSKNDGAMFDQLRFSTEDISNTYGIFSEITSFTSTFLSNDSLSLALNYNITGNDFSAYSGFDAPDQTNFSGKVSSISVSSGTSVPEPNSLAIFGSGILGTAGLAWLQRRRHMARCVRHLRPSRF